MFGQALIIMMLQAKQPKKSQFYSEWIKAGVSVEFLWCNCLGEGSSRKV